MTAERARFEGLLGMVDALVRAPDAKARIAADAAGFLRASGAGEADAEATAKAGNERLLLYRKLVRRGLRGAIREEIPRTAARLGNAFDGLVDTFIESAPPRSHYVRDVAFEFVGWAEARLAAGDAPYLRDLARHELSLFEVGSAPDGEGEGPEVALDGPVRFDPSVKVFRYDHAVHELSAELEATDAPAQRKTWLLGYRDAEHEVRYLAVTETAAAIVARLLAGETLRTAVMSSTTAASIPLDDAVLAGTARLLTDLRERGALLPSRKGEP